MDSTVITLATKGARRRIAPPDRQPDERLFNYYSPGGEIRVVCLDDEAESFERDQNIELDTDIFDSKELFQNFVSHLAEYKLKLL